MDPARPTARRIFLCARYVNQFTFARRDRRYHHLTWFTAGAWGFRNPGLRLPALPVFAARHLPLARATSLESWLDLSGAPHLRAGFFARTGLGARPAWRSRCTWWSDCLL